MVFEVTEDCWDATARVENYVLKKRIWRVLKADEVNDIEENVNLLRIRLLRVGVLKYVSTEIKDVQKRVDVLEHDGDLEEVFRSFLPDPVLCAEELLSVVSKTTVDRLKARIISPKFSTRDICDVGSE